MMTVFKRKQQNDEDKWRWELFKWNNKGCTLVFTHHSFDKGHCDGVKGRHPTASKSPTWSSSNYISLFQQDYKVKGPRTKPTWWTPPATQTEPSKARGNSCGRFPVEISHENFITGSSKARQGAAPLSPLRHLPTMGVPEKFWFLNFQVHNYPYMAIMDQ